jgi:hypothetical protein
MTDRAEQDYTYSRATYVSSMRRIPVYKRGSLLVFRVLLLPVFCCIKIH